MQMSASTRSGTSAVGECIPPARRRLEQGSTSRWPYGAVSSYRATAQRAGGVQLLDGDGPPGPPSSQPIGTSPVQRCARPPCTGQPLCSRLSSNPRDTTATAPPPSSRANPGTASARHREPCRAIGEIAVSGRESASRAPPRLTWHRKVVPQAGKRRRLRQCSRRRQAGPGRTPARSGCGCRRWRSPTAHIRLIEAGPAALLVAGNGTPDGSPAEDAAPRPGTSR